MLSVHKNNIIFYLCMKHREYIYVYFLVEIYNKVSIVNINASAKMN